MNRMTLGDVKNTRIPLMLNLCSTDTRFIQYINEAQERLITRGKWFGTWQRYVICVNNGCLTWPRQIETIEAVWICNRPINIRNAWFEALQSGPGLQDDETNSRARNYLQLYDRDPVVSFDDMLGVDEQIRVYMDNANDAGTTINFEGYDENGNWILTNNGATQGETVTLGMPFVNTTNKFTSLLRVRKDVTLGNVRVYAYNTVTATQRAIAVYEPSETRPLYRRSLIARLSQIKGCDGSPEGECEKTRVTVMAMLRFIPVANDNDWLIISNMPALKDMCMALYHREKNEFQLAEAFEASAIRELDKELARYVGDGAVQPLKIMGAEIWGAGNTEGLM